MARAMAAMGLDTARAAGTVAKVGPVPDKEMGMVAKAVLATTAAAMAGLATGGLAMDLAPQVPGLPLLVAGLTAGYLLARLAQ